MLLAAVLLCVGQNAWGQEANLTPMADTYFSWNTGNAGTSYGTAETLYCGIWQEMWTNATPGLKGNGSTNIAVFKFDVSDYKGKITGATFKVTATNPSSNTAARSIYLGYFDSTSWTESSTANNSGMNTRTASGLNIHPFNLSQSIAKGQTKEVSFSSDAFLTYLNGDEDGIVSLIIYGVGQECSVNSKEAASGKPSLTLTYTDETVYTATFTANSGAITPTVTIYSDEERTTPVTNGTLTDKTTYYYRAVLAGYNNNEGSFTVNGANPSVSFTMTKKTRYTFTVNAVDAGSNILKTIYTDADSYEGKTHNIVYPKYLTGTGNIVTYSKDNDTYGENKTAQAQNETYTVGYTAYNGVAYFVEVEDVVSATAYGSWNCSNGSAVRGFTDAKSIFTVPVTGVYDITYAACNNNVNYDMAVTLSKNDTEIATKSDLKSVSINQLKTNGVVVNSNINLTKDDVLKLKPSTTNGILDYLFIQLMTPVTVSDAGYATYVNSDYDLDFSATSIEAYKVKVSSKGVATLTKVNNVPAGTPVLLYKEGGATENIPVMTDAAAVTENDLVAGNSTTATEGVATTAGDYTNMILNNIGGKIGFYFANGQTVAANRAYLHILTTLAPNAVGGARMAMRFAGDNITAVENVEAAAEAKAKEGKFIENGKLVIVKNGQKYNAAGAKLY